MKKLKEELKYGKRGITLIALVITIIVLLILAGVSIATLTGDNGILTQANNAKERTEEAEDIEKIRLAISEAQIGESGYQELDATNFQEALNSQFEGRNLQLTDNGDGSFIVNLDNMSKMYYVDNDGKIINDENMLAIGTSSELKAFRDDVNSGNTYEGKYVYLTDNITLDINEEWEPIGLYPMENSSINDETTNPFSGVFDGKNYEINGLYVNTTDKGQGLFGLVVNGAIKNVGIGENCTITGNNVVGAVVGYLYNGCVINCYNKANVEGATQVGGIAGTILSNVEILNCYNSGNIKGTTFNVGGIVGNCMTSQIINCYNTGSVEAVRPAGIAGQSLQKSIIENCYNVGNITIIEGDTGVDYSHYGIVAVLHEEDEVSNCYYLNGSVNGGNDIDECKGVLNKSSEELKILASTLGRAFKDDINNINNGYPILEWQ